jgi:hypothetical protein
VIGHVAGTTARALVVNAPAASAVSNAKIA